MKYQYRCSREKCKRRMPLRKPIEQYARAKKCPSCGGTQFRLDKDRMQNNREQKCFCDGYIFPHREGSLQCKHYDGPRDAFNGELAAAFEEEGVGVEHYPKGQDCPF